MIVSDHGVGPKVSSSGESLGETFGRRPWAGQETGLQQLCRAGDPNWIVPGADAETGLRLLAVPSGAK